jgi:hypothetical protein
MVACSKPSKLLEARESGYSMGQPARLDSVHGNLNGLTTEKVNTDAIPS